MDNLLILIDDCEENTNTGSIFSGTIEQFRDCFFSDATILSIIEWAINQGYRITFLKLEK